MFELLGPSNPHITVYESDGVGLLAIRRLEDNNGYYNWDQMAYFYETMSYNMIGFKNIRLPKRIAHGHGMKTLEQVMDMMECLDSNNEGYVLVHNDTGERLKLKNPSWLELRSVKSDSASSMRNIAMLIVGGDYDEYVLYFPEMNDKFVPFIENMEAIENDIEHFRSANPITDISVRGSVYARAVKIFGKTIAGIAMSYIDGNSLGEIMEHFNMRYGNSRKKCLELFEIFSDYTKISLKDEVK